METRKVQQVGGGTYTVSIPVQWATEHGVEAGGTAYLHTHADGSLVVRWDEQEERALASTTIELPSDDPSAAVQHLDAAYTAGFERINLESPTEISDGQRRAIATRVRTLSGLGIVEETDTTVTVRGLLDASNVSIQQSVQQLQFVVLSMHEAAMAAFAGETADVDHVIEREAEADRLARLIERHLSRSLVELSEVDRLGVTRAALFSYYRVASALEEVASEAVRVAKAVKRANSVPSCDLAADVRVIGADARSVVESAAETTGGAGAPDTAYDASDRCAALRRDAEAVDQALSETPPEDAYLLTRVLDSAVRTAEYGKVIAARALRPSHRE